ncbi:unnamed protein product [Dicrocoelium dendriticum]|nr:unnamed protein product [Dicrocoelium dendriticum]
MTTRCGKADVTLHNHVALTSGSILRRTCDMILPKIDYNPSQVLRDSEDAESGVVSVTSGGVRRNTARSKITVED